MPILVTCAGCKSKVKVPAAAAGRAIKCPKCKAPLTIPEEDDSSSGTPLVPTTDEFATASQATADRRSTPQSAPASQATVAYVPKGKGRYTLNRLHAKGGIGQVWLARDSDLGREIALKELRPERAQDQATWRRFVAEAQITGQLEHPGIVPVYELIRQAEGDQPFYTMRFVHGRTLTKAIHSYHKKRARGTSTPMDLLALINAFVAVCHAVAYATPAE